jgi:hypothetical protein
MLLRKLCFLLPAVLCLHAAVPKELQALADQARGLPPEFAADVLLTLAASPLATDARWKRAAIEDAFLDAHELTLQTRAVNAMADLDPARALALFQDIPTLRLPAISCQQSVVPDVSPYYQTAGALFDRAFTAAERRKGDDIQFLRERVAAVDSPLQVVPALKLIDQVALGKQNRSELVALLAVALDRVHGSDREFAASEPLLVSAAVPEMHELSFLPVLRAYIVRHASGPRCSDRLKAGELPDSAAQFNKLISRVDPAGTQFHAITAEEAMPLRDDGTYPTPAKVQAPEATLQSLERQYDIAGNRAAWFQQFRQLLPHLDLEQAVHSPNPVISAYAQMAKLLGPS